MTKKQNDIKISGNIQPWDRQTNESKQAFEAFAVYRDLADKRSCTTVARQLAKSIPLIKRWSVKYNWVDRCRLYDIEQDRIRLVERHKQINHMNDNHVKIAQSMLLKAARRLNSLEPENMTVQELIRLVEIATKLERIALGAIDELGRMKYELESAKFEFEKKKAIGDVGDVDLVDEWVEAVMASDDYDEG